MPKADYTAKVPGVIDPDNLDEWQEEQDQEADRRQQMSQDWHDKKKQEERELEAKRRKHNAYQRHKRALARKRGAITAQRSQMLLQKLEKKNFHVLDELINIFQRAGELETVKEELELKERIASRLMGYCFPKLRSTEVSTDTGNATFINISIPPPVNVTPKQSQIPEADVTVCLPVDEEDGA